MMYHHSIVFWQQHATHQHVVVIRRHPLNCGILFFRIHCMKLCMSTLCKDGNNISLHYYHYDVSRANTIENSIQSPFY